MLERKPLPHMSSFNLLLGGVAKVKHYDYVISFHVAKDGSSKIWSLDFVTLSILINCFCNLRMIDLSFSVLGIQFKCECHPNVVIFNSPIRGLCNGGHIHEAFELFKVIFKFGCKPNTRTWGEFWLIDYVRMATQGMLFNCIENLVVTLMSWLGFQADLVCYSTLIDGLCKDGLVYEAKELLLEMEGNRIPFVCIFLVKRCTQLLCLWFQPFLSFNTWGFIWNVN